MSFESFGEIIRRVERQFFRYFFNRHFRFEKQLFCLFDFEFIIVCHDRIAGIFFELLKNVSLTVINFRADIFHRDFIVYFILKNIDNFVDEFIVQFVFLQKNVISLFGFRL